MSKVDEIFEGVTDRIIAMLEQGVAPWRKPWRAGGALPYNAFTGREYRGMLNAFILGFAGQSFGCNAWVGFDQCKKMGGTVKGQKSTWILAPLIKKERDASGVEQSKVYGFRGAYVFNVAQCQGIKLPEVEERQHDPHAIAEAICDSYQDPPAFFHDGGGRAFYRINDDSIHMPKPESFGSTSEYYGTKFHEYVHSTGAERRLNRDGIRGFDGFGSHLYSQEELVAEMGAAYLMALTGLPPVEDNSAAYIGSWLKKLQNDREMVKRAALESNRAARHIAGRYLATRESTEVAAAA